MTDIKSLNEVLKEDKMFYYFVFKHKTVKYPKHYFMEITQ